MFYDPLNEQHGLPRNPFKSLVVPRPIAWITTLSLGGVLNVAPYSHFNICSSEPPAVMFAPDGLETGDRRKDSHRNAEETGEFVVNLVTYDMREQMNVTSKEVPPEVSEATLAGLDILPSVRVKVPRLAASPVQLECRHVISIGLPNNSPRKRKQSILIGQVVGIHINERVLTNGYVDISKLLPVARMGYQDYAVIRDTFTLNRP